MYREKHPAKKSKNGKRIGRPPKRKNEKFEPPKLANEETKANLLTHVRYPLMKSPDDWTDFQRGEMHLLFEIEPKRPFALSLAHLLQGGQDFLLLNKLVNSFKMIVIVGERMKLRRDNNGIVLMGVYEFLKNATLLNA